MSTEQTERDPTVFFSRRNFPKDVILKTPDNLLVGEVDLMLSDDDEDRDAQSIYSALHETLGEELGYSLANTFQHRYPMDTLAKIRVPLQVSLEQYSVKLEQRQLIMNWVDAYTQQRTKQVMANISRGLIEFDNVPYVFPPGTAVVCEDDDDLIAGTLESVQLQHSWNGPFYQFNVKIYHTMSGTVEDSTYHARMGYWKGAEPLTKLPVRKMEPKEQEALTERGRIFRDVTAEASYYHYDGHLVRSTWNGPKNYRAIGRIMVDMASFMQIDHNQYQQETYVCGVETRGREKGKRLVVTIPDADLWRCSPYIYGFSFAAKQWGRLRVAELKPIAWRDDAWDKLVLEPELKDLVRALVDNQSETFSDIVDGKGGGTIFLLHGPPGQGKTLTAEAIAERLRRPLYSVSIGELGINPDELEKRLRVILDIATTWNAVILIDEADIFLEKRDENNIVRNAMVGVFLRLLEYHQGVLFLTTNRVKQIDEAFFSRISVALHFEDQGVGKRGKLWTNLLSAAQLDVNPNTLSGYDLNGREIKSVIRQAMTLAKDRKMEVTSQLLTEVVDLKQKFALDLKK